MMIQKLEITNQFPSDSLKEIDGKKFQNLRRYLFLFKRKEKERLKKRMNRSIVFRNEMASKRNRDPTKMAIKK